MQHILQVYILHTMSWNCPNCMSPQMCFHLTISMQVNQHSWNSNRIQQKALYYSNLKDNHTWHHDSLTKLCFMKLTTPKHVTFDNPYKLHQISYAPIINNLWLPLIMFLGGVQLYEDPIDLRTCLMVLHASRFTSFKSWITLVNEILVQLFKKYFTSHSSCPYDIYKLAYQIYLIILKHLVLFHHTLRGMHNFWFAMNKKLVMGPPTNVISSH
jgi:hypothetical protein